MKNLLLILFTIFIVSCKNEKADCGYSLLKKYNLSDSSYVEIFENYDGSYAAFMYGKFPNNAGSTGISRGFKTCDSIVFNHLTQDEFFKYDINTILAQRNKVQTKQHNTTITIDSGKHSSYKSGDLWCDSKGSLKFCNSKGKIKNISPSDTLPKPGLIISTEWDSNKTEVPIIYSKIDTGIFIINEYIAKAVIVIDTVKKQISVDTTRYKVKTFSLPEMKMTDNLWIGTKQ